MDSSKNDANEILSHQLIIERTKNKWDLKSSNEKVSSGKKYKHIFEKLKEPNVNWDNAFSELSKHQANILIKGELIRTYDSLSNYDKTKLKRKHKLSAFSSKWFRLPPCDKKTLLNFVLNEQESKTREGL